MKAVEIKPDIYWVGAIDWAIRDFHGYITQNGTTYNNYLIKDEKITLVDTVKHDFSSITIENIREIVDPEKIDYVVINHIEPDHVSSIESIMSLCPNAVIHISERGKKGLDRYFDTSHWQFKVVKNGETLKTGRYTLLFLETPMLHWPDSMVTYVKEAKLLISQDAFGQHIATASRFDDEFIACASQFELEDAVVDYYANILMPFGQLIKNKIGEIVKLGLEIDMIAPDHGVIWRKDPGKIIQTYLDLASGKCNLSIAIIYDTMWHSTEYMTTPIMQGIKDEGIDCKVIKLRATPMSIAIKEFWKARGCLIGSPTINNVMFPSVAEFLYHLSGLRPKNRIVGAFGSFGWGGGAVKEAYEMFKKMGLEIIEPGIQIQYRPTKEDRDRCYDFGREFAKKVREYHIANS
ncbi:MAG TPA: FprA family A-type flavoprotein [Syntrophorhabdaceae bacterium]|nr:FprA family A-type flavoprotein [Syntrophorhabdaceae bacterium]HOT41127.1 FprA family A-type flavoprotein [Syntrophorhabdaceae bacterium]HPC66170.1 FprA family A-type flavoprotein [Syntrophorhabdaceae bacterium]HQE79153.1 FprA family A-type flavoprotein [Syntrophorhabdaceae bacterium]HQH42865.1 FprA family A-type flavoprotein [Syntrophorhabdaceae bacterium]